MNIEYSKKKRELRSDPLLEWLTKAKTLGTTHAQAFVVAAVVVAVAAVATMLVLHTRGAAYKKADAAFGMALQRYRSAQQQQAILEFGEVANEYRGTPQSTYAAYMLGMILIQAHRPAEAVEWLEIASRGGRRAGFVPAAAVEGLSMAYEAQADFSTALDYAARALADRRLRHRHPTIRWRMALLNSELRNSQQALSLCRTILSDTLAVMLHQKARNLQAELEWGG